MCGSTDMGRPLDGMSITTRTPAIPTSHTTTHITGIMAAAAHGQPGRYYNTKAWVKTDNLGDAPYDGGYGPANQWFHVNSGTYAGDVYIGDGVTYYSCDCHASGATFWSHSSDGSWSYYDSSKWVPTTGFNVEPTNVWFRGFGSDAGWDTYNDSNTGDSYFTHDNTHYWDHTGGGSWTYYNTKAWVGTDNLGDAPFDGGYGPANQWFHVNAGTYAGDVYIADGVTYYSCDCHASGATFWSHSGDGSWQYYDSSKWVPTTGFNVEPTDVWFHGYGADAGWDVYNASSGECYYTHDNAHYWEEIPSSGSGTPAVVADVSSAPGSGLFPSFANVNGTLYFSATDGAHGYELWKSDGTASGTVLLKDINPGSGEFQSIRFDECERHAIFLSHGRRPRI